MPGREKYRTLGAVDSLDKRQLNVTSPIGRGDCGKRDCEGLPCDYFWSAAWNCSFLVMRAANRIRDLS